MDQDAARKAYLDSLVSKYETQAFILLDPISVPHGFDDPADQEIIGLFAALLAWGQRKTVLNKLAELCERMDYKPRTFVYNFDISRHAPLLRGFKHRTFQPTDAIWLIHNLSAVLKRYQTIEEAFATFDTETEPHVGSAIQGFSDLLFSINPTTPSRLRKHLARPATGSACKRLCMYLRWMTRPGPVDLGIWTKIPVHKLVLPLDVHSGRQARALGILNRKQDDWRAALELTEACKKLSPEDPAKYDYAFFGVGAYKEELDPRFVKNPIVAK